jgi:hypothetical protein
MARPGFGDPPCGTRRATRRGRQRQARAPLGANLTGFRSRHSRVALPRRARILGGGSIAGVSHGQQGAEAIDARGQEAEKEEGCSKARRRQAADREPVTGRPSSALRTCSADQRAAAARREREIRKGGPATSPPLPRWAGREDGSPYAGCRTQAKVDVMPTKAIPRIAARRTPGGRYLSAVINAAIVACSSSLLYTNFRYLCLLARDRADGTVCGDHC